MITTPLTAKELYNIQTLQGWNQFRLADLANVHRATLGQHLNNTRAIRDEHLLAYLCAIPTPDRPRLLAAWLHDLFNGNPEALASILHNDPSRMNESALNPEIRQWAPSLNARQINDLTFLSDSISTDEDMDTLLQILVRKAKRGSPAVPISTPNDAP